MAERPLATILFVDDDVSNRQTLGWLFREAGYRTLEAGTGQEAMELAAQGPDLVVLDVNLPDITGYEVCRRLRAAPATRSICVLQMSAVYVASGDRSLGLEEGADAYLIKPVEPRELLATVKALLRIRAAEEAARHAAQEWRTTFDAISDAVCLVDGDGVLCRCNRAMSDLVSRPFEELIGQPLGEVLRTGLALPQAPHFAGAGLSDREVQEVCLADRWFRVTSDPLPRGDGCVVILHDVTRRKELEEQLRQRQRLEAIGRLAGGVAHDFNNLLTAILGNASLLLRSLPSAEPEHELAATIERAATRAADLTRQLLGFSRQALLWLEMVDMCPLLTQLEQELRRGLREGIELAVHCPAGLWAVQADPRQLEQVLRHLGLNAIDAMPGGGRLVLSAANERVDVGQEGRHLDACAGDYLRVRIEDNGEGIPPEVVDKIFDPFFTTKPVGRGSGLGLAMVHGIVKQHLGWVECHSAAGVGTRFDLFFPRAQPAAVVQPPTPALVAAPSGGRRVLLADDNETLRSLAAMYLRQDGFEVLLAGDGEEAVEVYSRLHGQIDLVILDQLMPRVTGGEALRRMRQINPDLRALLASSTWAARTDEDADPGLVAKPYRERDLLRAVHAALSEGT